MTAEKVVSPCGVECSSCQEYKKNCQKCIQDTRKTKLAILYRKRHLPAILMSSRKVLL